METLEIRSNTSEIEKATDFIRERLTAHNVAKREVIQVVLASEEVLATLISKSTTPDQPIRLAISKFLGNTEVRFTAHGHELVSGEIENRMFSHTENEEDAEAAEAMQKLYAKILRNRISVRRRKDQNILTLSIHRSHFTQLVLTLLALLAGIATGLILKAALPGEASAAVSANVFTPIYTAFMNALKMIVAPVVFTSIAASIAGFNDLKALGRIAGKVVVFYLFTSMLAIGVGLLTYSLFPIGDPSLQQAVSAKAAEATLEKSASANVSIIDTLVGIVPSDVITPFQQSNMLQIIFMAVMLGLAIASFSGTYPALQTGMEMLNRVLGKITASIVAFIPLIVFCAMARTAISMNLSDMVQALVWVPTVYLGDVLMIGVYMILLLIFGRLNPLKFLAKYYPAMLAAFTLSASTPALPSSIRQCEKLGVSEKIYSFSLPLGATINMDGSCISLMITSLFFAKIFGIPISESMLLSLFLSIMVLSVGSPGVPGGNLVCITLLIPQIGIPSEAISLVMGLYPIVGMMQSCVNVSGDATVTTLVAKQEGLLDLQKYNNCSVT